MTANVSLQTPPDEGYTKEDFLFSMQVVGAIISVVLGLYNFRKMLIESQIADQSIQFLSGKRRLLFLGGILLAVGITVGALYYFRYIGSKSSSDAPSTPSAPIPTPSPNPPPAPAPIASTTTTAAATPTL